MEIKLFYGEPVVPPSLLTAVLDTHRQSLGFHVPSDRYEGQIVFGLNTASI